MNEAQQPLNALPQGHRLQEYELVRVLGFGGYGMTYLGFDLNLDKAVAIKEYLPSDIATRTGDNSVAPQASQFRDDFEWGLERFLDEARALARFDHRHIIKVHRFFEAHGTAYIVMEYAEGETLSAFLERKMTLKESELKAILYPILDGLDVVHGADFLHRDIKPGNIIIRDEDNSPVLLDFGSARQAIGVRSRSVTSIITPGYAPIEQYSSRGNQGPWTDIYALGGVCYRALIGEVPDDATDRVRNDPLISVVERCAGQVSAGFLSAIDWALAVDEADRPQSISEWRAKLEDDLTGAQKDETADGTVVMQGDSQGPEMIDNTDLLVGAQEREMVDETTVEQQDAPLSDTKKKTKGKLYAIVIALVMVIFFGKVFVDYQAEMQRHKLHNAVKENAYDTVELLLKNGADVNKESTSGDIPLHIAVRENARETAEVLLKHGANPNAEQKKDLNTPLGAAAKNNAHEIAGLLLKHGADINAVNTPLHIAVKENARETAEVLLEHGANPNAKNFLGHGHTPLYLATLNNARETVELLLKHGANPNVNDALLVNATLNNARETVELLLKHGANPNVKDINGNVALHHTITGKSFREMIAELLLKNGANPNVQNSLGYTPLHKTAKKNAHTIAELLLKHGAAPNVKDRIGSTPLYFARLYDARETEKVLRRYGGRRW